jgi:AcrR family transcriptional regulator
VKRAYNSPLRADQATATRRRILEAAVDSLASTGRDDLTVGEVATAASVSERTVYNHFGSLDGLLDAVSDHLDTVVIPDPAFDDADSFVDAVRAAWRFTQEQERVFRAATTLPDRTRRARYARQRKVLRPLVDGLPARDARVAMAAMFLVRGGAAYDYLRAYGATPDEAADAMAWLLQLAIADLRRRVS